MKYATAALALAAGASAHSVMSEIFIDGEGQGSGTCIRTPNQAKGAVDPITDLASKEMACGKDGTVGVARTCSMGGDQKLTFEWRQWPDDRSKQRFPYGHMGPCSVYMKKVDDATQDGATGDGWFKLWDDDLDYGSGKWCTQQMVENEGHMTVTIPNSLAGGDYLVRPELIALHNVPAKGYPEYYQQCAQIFLQSTGSSAPNETVSIPGHVSPQDPGNTYNPFEKPLKHYTIPGPAVASLSGTGEKMTDMQQKNGLKPKNTVVTNRNWSGVEIPSYTDEEGCWDSDKKCWDQVDKCYDTAGATGLEGCKTFQEYCKENQGNCKTGNSGPPNKGANWEPKHDTCSAPPVLNAGMDYHASSSGSSSSDKSPSDYTQKKGKAPSNDNQQEAAPSSSEEAAPQYTQAPQQDNQPAPTQAAPTTMVTQASADPNVVYETDYATVVAYETVTAQAYRRHAHPRHAH